MAQLVRHSHSLHKQDVVIVVGVVGVVGVAGVVELVAVGFGVEDDEGVAVIGSGVEDLVAVDYNQVVYNLRWQLEGEDSQDTERRTRLAQQHIESCKDKAGKLQIQWEAVGAGIEDLEPGSVD